MKFFLKLFFALIVCTFFSLSGSAFAAPPWESDKSCKDLFNSLNPFYQEQLKDFYKEFDGKNDARQNLYNLKMKINVTDNIINSVNDSMQKTLIQRITGFRRLDNARILIHSKRLSLFFNFSKTGLTNWLKKCGYEKTYYNPDEPQEYPTFVICDSLLTHPNGRWVAYGDFLTGPGCKCWTVWQRQSARVNASVPSQTTANKSDECAPDVFQKNA